MVRQVPTTPQTDSLPLTFTSTLTFGQLRTLRHLLTFMSVQETAVMADQRRTWAVRLDAASVRRDLLAVIDALPSPPGDDA